MFFENSDTLSHLQDFLDEHLPDIQNVPEIFGHQVEVDENENIIYVEKKMLANAIARSINELEVFVHSNNGLIIPAHIDRRKNSIYSQLGFLPGNLKADALEVSRATSADLFADLHPEIKKFPLTRSSDAHMTDDIGKATTGFLMKSAEFNEIRMALTGTEGRRIAAE